MKDSYIFPAVFHYAQDGISIKFPDLPGCLSCADNEDEAVYMAEDALSGWLYICEQHNELIPEPSSTLALKASLMPNEAVVPVRADMTSYRARNSKRSANKMVTMPEWLLNMGRKPISTFHS